MVILYVYLRMVNEKITNLQSMYAYKKIQTVCKRKNLHTHLMRIWVYVYKTKKSQPKLRQITIDLCKSRLVTRETPRNHSLSQHQIVFAIVEIYIGIVTNIFFQITSNLIFKSH
jgi:hypothetical protein